MMEWNKKQKPEINRIKGKGIFNDKIYGIEIEMKKKGCSVEPVDLYNIYTD